MFCVYLRRICIVLLLDKMFCIFCKTSPMSCVSLAVLEVRLKDGAHSCEGRVEVKYQGEWGTVDDLNWSMEEAAVGCRQLGCGGATDAPKGAHFGLGIGPIWFRYIYCKSQESAITECSYPSVKDHRPEGNSHDKDAGAVCSALELRLINGDHSCEGRVEVKHQGKWGTVNDLNWSMEEAHVVCRQLRCGAAVDAPKGSKFGPGIGPVWFRYIYCKGQESVITECSYPSLKDHRTEGYSHNKDAGAICSAREVRLKDGAHSCEGRVEVKHQGKWGTVNDQNWSLEAAAVVCRELKCGAAINASRGAHFGPGIGPIWFQYIYCNGTESSLMECSYPPLKNYLSEGLSHDGDAGAVCSALEVRLKDGGHRCEGRVEVKHQGEWGTVNDHSWSLEEAQVVCRQLGCGAAIDAPGGAYFGPGIGPIWFHSTNCKGTESVLTVCGYPSLKDHRPEGLSHDQDAGAVCSDLELRLMDGDHPCEGRVEVKHQGAWGTVNDYNWNMEEAHVVCRQLRCGAAVHAPKGSKFGPGIGPIWFHYIYCKGQESAINECSYPVVMDHHPEGHSHNKDAGAVCSALEVRLKDGAHHCEGRVEVKHQGEWGTVNDQNWSLEEAQVVCRQLKCGAATDAPRGAYLGSGTGPIWFQYIYCNGTESLPTQCSYPPLKDHRPEGLSHDGDAGAVCSALEVRLKDGAHSCEGRVEVKHQGKWGTVNDLNWSLGEATVVCRQLGCGAATSASRGAHFGPGNGPIWFKYTYCKGIESVLTDCTYPVLKDYRPEGLSHDQDAGAVCSALEVRLKDGAHSCEGRVEVKHQGEWGTVNDYNWSMEEAAVVCRQLGCGGAVDAPKGTKFGPGIGPIWFHYIYCKGPESAITKCSYPTVKDHRPEGHSHDKDAGAVCSALELRLKDGAHRCEGRVEVKHQGEWGTVNDLNWSLEEASVVCRQLGCGTAVDAPKGTKFGPGIGPIWFHYIYCKGPESAITECSYPTVKDHRPEGHSHDKDAGAVCSEVQLITNGTSQCEGQVKMNISGRWRVLCASHWSLANANVVCRQLGCGVAISTPRGPHLVEGNDQISTARFHCSGAEAFLWSCPVTVLGGPDCSHGNTASVICSDSRQLRLVDGGGPCAGRVEILDHGSWGTICDDGWDLDDARVVCRQLGCGDALNATGSAHFGAGSGPIWLDDLNCAGNESHVWRCPSQGWGKHDCRHKQDAGVICSDREKLRLRGGDRECSGRVEVWHSGSWGTVCDDSWSLAEAEVVCQQLGCGPALEAVWAAAFGPGNGSIWLDEVRCGGRESSLWDCAAEPWGQSDCKHEEDAGVRCSGE
ncbi:hypothetical protein FD754_016057 [Muntiacus muntjak]|uniref:SRCR domain-containing protein n=1 Tax=Muntiacus muntjak TaxID=9888 RepID=A0A5N3VPD3_MUNMU|nr:hypothetical protein FD754_016057 [Muntiacus muntjak]